MRRSKQYKKIALSRLKGNWGWAVLVSLVAGLLSGGGGSALSFSTSFGNVFNSGGGNASPIPDYSGFEGEIVESIENVLQQPWFKSFIIGVAVIGLVVGLAWLLITSAITLGHERYYIGLIAGEKPKFDTLFSRFRIIFKAWGLILYEGLLLMLWYLPVVAVAIIFGVLVALAPPTGIGPALLLAIMLVAIFASIIPMIVAAYRYAMATYLMAQYPEKGIRESIRDSKAIMAGNKWRLFCVELGFIGWGLLAGLTLGIGTLWLTPYMEATFAAFYLDITGQLPKEEEAWYVTPPQLAPDSQEGTQV
ncbi:MAG: DUF975 family protein [Christensenellaceae bacterium]|jgi:uncharacterized membrane protein|nr:DUF975 family protein [Christensenellaceae bacterium]